MQKLHNAKRGFKIEIHHKLHAEMAALIKTNEDLNGASIYVFRRNKAGELANCRPCPACTAALLQRGVRHVHYTTATGVAYEDWS